MAWCKWVDVRVIAGRFRSRKLKSVGGLHVRPTPDRLRETLFSILMPRIAGAVFVDAYAGSGAVGIEALSRGARHVILLEKNRQALATIEENVQALEAAHEITVIRGAVSTTLPGVLATYRPDLVFLDPPYEETREYAASFSILDGAAAMASLVVQHPSRMPLPDAVERITKVRVVRQGDNSLSFYEPVSAAEER